MSSVARKWMQVLEARYGVVPEFSGHLLPVLERLAQQQPSTAEWEQVLEGFAAAYRSTATRHSHRGAIREVRLLADQFLDELRKMDESLKVLSVYLERLRDRMKLPATSARVLH